MKPPIKIHTIMFILALFQLMMISVSCNGSVSIPVDSYPDVGIPINEMNTKFQILVPRGSNNSCANGESLRLLIDVTSNEPIKFPIDYGARLFIFDGTKWTEIENKMSYYPEIQASVILYPSKNDAFKKGPLGVVPYVPNLKNAVSLRVILIGNIVRDGKVMDEKVATYVDLTLKPSNIRWK